MRKLTLNEVKELKKGQRVHLSMIVTYNDFHEVTPMDVKAYYDGYDSMYVYFTKLFKHRDNRLKIKYYDECWFIYSVDGMED